MHFPKLFPLQKPVNFMTKALLKTERNKLFKRAMHKKKQCWYSVLSNKTLELHHELLPNNILSSAQVLEATNPPRGSDTQWTTDPLWVPVLQRQPWPPRLQCTWTQCRSPLMRPKWQMQCQECGYKEVTSTQELTLNLHRTDRQQPVHQNHQTRKT